MPIIKRNAPIDITLRPHQYEIFLDSHRFKTITAGRRFGKTYYGRVEIANKAIKRQKQVVWYIAPTYRQAKQLMWLPLKELMPKDYIQHKDETDMSMILRNGSQIALRGADNPDSLRGVGLDHALFDECAFQAKYVQDVVRPMLSDRSGSATYITTPAGFNWYYDLVMDNFNDEVNWKHYHFTTLDGGNVTPEEIATARATMDPRMFKQEFEASFENLSGRVYYAFDRLLNCPNDITDDPTLPLRVGMDFNIDPMSAVLSVRKGKQLHVFDEIEIPNGNTLLMGQVIRARFPNRQVIVAPDPTGNKRQTNSPIGQTDMVILRSQGFTVLSPGQPYGMADKINMTNAALCNASNERRILINKKCRALIKGLDGLTFIPGSDGLVPDKKSGLDHMTDAFAYLACIEYPMVAPMRRIATTGVM